MKRILWWTFVAPLGFLVLCAIVLFLFKEKTRRDLDAYKANLISKGETFDLSKLGPIAPREGDELVRQFLAACEKASKFSRNNEFPEPLPDKLNKDGSLPVSSWSDSARYRGMEKTALRPSWEEIAKKFEPCEEFLSPIRDMLRKDNLEFHPDYSLGVALRMPYLTWLFDTTRLFQGDALIQLKKGNTARAIEDTEAIVRIGQIQQKQPLLMCQLGAFSNYKEAAALTWQIIHSRSASGPQLLALQQTWQTIDSITYLAPTIRLESAITVSQFSNPDRLLGFYIGDEPYQVNISKLKLVDQAEVLGSVAAWRWVLLHLDEHRTLESLQKLLGAIEENRTKENLPKLYTEARRISDEVRDSPLLINSSSTTTISIVTRGIATQAIANLTTTALALERYRLTNGGYPASLEELVSDYLDEIPKDPYDNSPLRYRKTPERFILYSIGDDLTDNNADEGYDYSYSNKPFERSNDIVWPLPAKAPDATAEKPRIVPKKFVRRLAAPSPTPAQRSSTNTP